MLRIVSKGVIILENSEEFLEEETAENDVGGLGVVWVQVVHMDIADRVASTNQHLFSECAQRDSNVGAIVAACKVEFECVVNVG